MKVSDARKRRRLAGPGRQRGAQPGQAAPAHRGHGRARPRWTPARPPMTAAEREPRAGHGRWPRCWTPLRPWRGRRGVGVRSDGDGRDARGRGDTEHRRGHRASRASRQRAGAGAPDRCRPSPRPAASERQQFAKYLTITKIKLENAITMVRSSAHPTAMAAVESQSREPADSRAMRATSLRG